MSRRGEPMDPIPEGSAPFPGTHNLALLTFEFPGNVALAPDSWHTLANSFQALTCLPWHL